MFDPKFGDLVAVMARDVAVRTTNEGRALDLALAVVTVLGECGTITGADVCHLAAAVGYDPRAVASAWTTRAGFANDARGIRERRAREGARDAARARFAAGITFGPARIAGPCESVRSEA